MGLASWLYGLFERGQIKRKNLSKQAFAFRLEVAVAVGGGARAGAVFELLGARILGPFGKRRPLSCVLSPRGRGGHGRFGLCGALALRTYFEDTG